ncbi:DUF305 domain-containing protein [Actinoplanes sp. N902-109]|uniref:DUF305 domain-containing protein n=1 Tax=Actinoplanes sp. (strain N902-109) TaxID=649831 RepID=UPI000329558F|nr:DUF305 domain-containing protein [Actinoplanes sp. N902-109]AGL14282.1 hypothetical protein L083_0772 [Actinoplanes sp. N902-109]
MNRRTWTRFALVAVALAGIVSGAVLAGRMGGDRSAAAPRPSAVAASPQRVILPGRPGESARVTDSDKVKAPDGSTYNAVDTAFVQMMIVHHGQAVAMAALAPGRAGDQRLAALADRIGAAQQPEIAWMKAWLRDRRLPESDPSHDHGAMPGMQSEADMTALAGLSGAAFDRRFVAMMSDHHRGALRMATDVLTGGTDVPVNEFAGEMAVEQGSEIRRMQQLHVG